MDDLVSELEFRPRPTADRPLLGMTVLVVEDSRFASEAVRLLCLRSGARIRRADCIGAAEKHLHVYRPSVAIVDLGLPDGSGLDLIARMHELRPRVPILLGTSGADRDEGERCATDAGADGFLPKPIESLATFQAVILGHLPETLRPRMPPRLVVGDSIAPDKIAYREDLAHAMDLLALDEPPLGYLRRFLLGVARTAHDGGLEDRARDMGHDRTLAQDDRRALRAFLSQRMQAVPMAM